MHELTVLSLAIAFALLASLLLALCVRGLWPAWVKCAVIVLVSGFYLYHYKTLEQALGWPTFQSPPEKFLLIAHQVIEPDPANGSEGAIYLWAASIDSSSVEDTPRSYALPYTKNLHAKLDSARAGQRKGIPQIGEIDEQEQRYFATRLTARQVDNIEIYDLPEPTLPDK